MASGSTPIYNIPYPLATDPVDVHGDIEDLADRLETLFGGYALLNSTNTFTQPNIFQVNSASTAVRITQTGTGASLLVEDSANPDLTPFIINSSGNVGIGTPTPLEKLQVDGISNLTDVLLVGAGARSEYYSGGAISATVAFKAYSSATTRATITTTTAHGFFPGLVVDIALSPADPVFDGSKEIIDVPTPTTFTYAALAGSTIPQTSTSGSAEYVGGYTNPVALFSINAPDYSQVVFKNSSSSANASTDIIAYSDNGNDYHGWIDMGITSSGFNDPSFTITGENDGYIFMSAPYGTSGAGNLVLATDGTGTENKIIFAAGGLSTDNTQMEITPDVNVHVEIATPSTDNTTGAFTVVGGVGITGDVNTLGYVAVEGILYAGDDAKGFNTSAALTNPRMVVRNTEAVNQSSYSQIAFQNADPTSSTDFIVYMDNGVDSEGWMDFGITGSQFDDTTYGITSPGDGYLFLETATDIVGPGYKGNMVFATGANGIENKIVFAAGGFASGNTQMEITPDVNVHIEIPTQSVDPTTGALTVVGGTGIQGNLNVAGNVNIVGDLSFGGGSTTTETLGVTDPAIFVGVNNDDDVFDLGLYLEYAVAITPIVKSIDQKSLTSDIATLRTTTNHGYLAGDVVDITGVGAPFDGTNINIIDVPTTTTFTYAKVNANVPVTAVSPVGTATVTHNRKYGGFIRDASDGVFKMFTGLTTTPTGTANLSEPGVVFGDLKLNSLDLVTPLDETDGGTGLSAYTTGDLLYASATNTLSRLAIGANPNGYLLTIVGGIPAWAAAPVSLPPQTGNNGKFLTTDGTTASWAFISGGAASPTPPTTGLVDGTLWLDTDGVLPNLQSVERFVFYPSAGATTVSGTDALGNVLTFTPGKEQVYLNGAMLVRGNDYATPSGSTISGLIALSSGDVVEIIAINPFYVGTNGIQETIISAKGDIIVGAANDTAAVISAGTNGYILSTNSATATGLEWIPVTADATSDIFMLMGV